MTAASDATQDLTRWELEARSRWGEYVAEAYREMLLKAQSALSPPGDALDIGCEAGRWSRLLVDHGWSVTSIDVDAEALATCSRRVPEADRVLVAPDATTLPVPDQSVSLAVCICVRAVIQSDWIASEVMRVVKPGGLLVASTWNRSSGLGLVADATSRMRGGGSHEFYSESYLALRRRFEEAGLRMVDERGLNWVPFPRGSDARLLPPAARIERRLGLQRLTTVSPWVLFTARRP